MAVVIIRMKLDLLVNSITVCKLRKGSPFPMERNKTSKIRMNH